MFDKNALKDFNDVVVEQVKCPEWGEQGKHIYVKTMSGADRDNYEMKAYHLGEDRKEGEDAPRKYNVRAEMAVFCVCDKDGNLLFTDEDAEWLGKKAAGPLDRIMDVSNRLSKISEADVKEMEKSLKGGQT